MLCFLPLGMIRIIFYHLVFYIITYCNDKALLLFCAVGEQSVFFFFHRGNALSLYVYQ